MNIIQIINEEINNSFNGRVPAKQNRFRVFTQQYNDDFIRRGQNQPVYFSNDPNYWSDNEKHRYEAIIWGNNIVDLRKLQNEIDVPPEYLEVHELLINDIIKLKETGKYETSIMEDILMSAYDEGGEELQNKIKETLINADLIIGNESAFEEITTYVVMNPQKQVKLPNETPN